MRFGMSHVGRIDDRPTRLLLNSRFLARQSQNWARLKHCLENRWSTASTMLPPMADGCGLGIGTPEPNVMAGIATDGVLADKRGPLLDRRS